MNRREFLRAAGASGLVVLVTPTGVIHAFTPDASTSLVNGFVQPPSSAKPNVFYLFMNGHVSAVGITKDLEALSRAGIGGILNYNAGVAIPKGPVEYFSDEWYALLKHTVNEAERFGLEYSMHNCPGWSSSGGPWVTPEMSMQKVVWSETRITGGKKIKMKLPQPLSRHNYYDDSLVVAFPSLPGEETDWNDNVKKSSTNSGAISLDGLSNGKGIEIEGAKKAHGFLLLEFDEPFEVQSVFISAINTKIGSETVHSVGPFEIETSDDGITFKPVARMGISSGNPGIAETDPVKTRFVRISTPASATIKELNFYSSIRRLSDWMVKGNYKQRPTGTRMYQKAPFAGEEPLMQPGELETVPVAPAYIIKTDDIIDLTSKMTEGEIEWNAPSGNWTIVRFGHTSTGVTNRAAPTNGQGLECDKFSKEAFDHHFDQMFQKIMPLLKPLASKGRAAVEIDSYEVGMQNWTRALPQEFEKSRGYSLVKYMPAFTGRVVGSNQETENFLWDARRVMSDLMAENYYGRCAARCHENGLLFYGEPYKMGPMEGIQVGSRMDNVMGEFWARGQRNGRTLKLASSIQHLNGKKIIAAESFTGHSIYSKWQQYPFSMKAQGDYMFTQGLTRMIFHTSAHQPHPTVKPGMTMGPFGTHIDRNVTWFDQAQPWLQYIARCQYMLQQGLFVADLLFYIGEDAPGEEIGLKESPVPAPEFGTHFDYINTELLLNKVKIRDGRITLPDGMSYSLLILPPKNNMTLPVLKKLKELVAGGMKMMGPFPTELAGLSDYPEGKKKLDDLVSDLWGTDPAVAEHAFGKGKVFRTGSLNAVISRLNIQKDFTFTAESTDPAINYIHRVVGDTDMYFIANRKRRFENLVCSFRIQNKVPEFWDADSGVSTPVSIFREVSGRISIPVHLQPSGSVFLVFKKGDSSKALESITRNGITLLGSAQLAVNQNGIYKNLFNNFTQSVWLKPESDIAVTGMNVMRREDVSSFAFSPSQGEVLYGRGHAICGLTVGRNGAVVYERTDELVNPVLEVLKPLEGWTHLSLVYQDGAPLVYINGEMAGKGKPSTYKVHPCVNEEYQDIYTLFFEGDINKPQLVDKVLSREEIKKLALSKPRISAMYPDVEILPSKLADLIIWKNGRYDFKSVSGRSSPLNVTGLRGPIELVGEWNVAFPEGTRAPSAIKLPDLRSLHKHPLPGVKYFSGTATYTREFNAELPARGLETFLDLGQVEVLAEVELNGNNLGIVWKKPYRVNITGALKDGVNQLKIKVTNLWPNRLIGDEQFPEENAYNNIFENQRGGKGIDAIPEWYIKGQPKPKSERTTFSTWKHYKKDDPLLESGLVGPVKIHTGVYIKRNS